MKSVKKYNIRLAYLVVALLMTGCKVSPALYEHSHPALPETFTGNTDTASIGNIPVRTFFNDPFLTGLIDSALKNNFDIRIAAERMEILKAGYHLRKGLLLPQVAGKADAGVARYGDYTMNGVGNFDTNLSPNISGDRTIPAPTPEYFIGFQSNWEIDLWGKLRNQKKAAYARYLSSGKGWQLIATSLVAEIAQLYYELLALDSKLAILRENISLQQKGVEIIEIQKSAGNVTQLAVEQFSAQLLNTKSEEAILMQQIVNTENRMNFLLGRLPQPVPRGNAIDRQEFPEEIKAGIPASMLLRRPDIRQAELELAAAHADVEAARLAFMPSVTLTPYVGLNAFKAGLLANPGSLAYGIVSGLTVPVLNRRALKANHKISRARKEQAVLAYGKTVFGAYGEVVTGLKAIENYQKVYELKKEEAKVLKSAVSTSNDLFLAGYASYLEVITAQKNVLAAELGLINAREAQFKMLITLYRSLGGGWK